jgi:hypothetical protein
LDTGRRLVRFDYLARRRAHSYASSAGKHIQPHVLGIKDVEQCQTVDAEQQDREPSAKSK